MALKHLITCVVAGLDYLVHPQILGTVQESVRADQIIPVVVLSEEEVSAGPEKLWDILHDLVTYDDVCTDEFTGIIVVKPSTAPESAAESSQPLNTSALELALNGTGASIYYLSSLAIQSRDAGQDKPQLASGPYFLSGQNLHQAWRLYPDEYESFVYGLLPDDFFNPTSFQAIAPQTSGGLTKSIPVPSRHYYKPTANQPLAGARISVQDILDIKGTKTSLSSRAWAQLYPGAATTNAAYVEWLLAQGAVLVGKTKMTQLGTAQEWVDFQSPVGPRGDGYQDVSGAAAGAAASLAGYSWLDHAIGLDSVGDVRAPATQHGLHAIRTTFGTAALDDSIKIFPRYDTVGIFGRSLDHLALLANHSLAAPTNANDRTPRRIIYPTDFFPIPDPAHQQLIDLFIEKLETLVGTKKDPLSLDKLWDESRPPQSSSAGHTLREFMQKAPMWSFAREFHDFTTKFREDYRDNFNREPFIEASSRFWSDVGANVTETEYRTYLERVRVFEAWFDENVLPLNHNSLEDGIVILPFGASEPRYRDVPSIEPTIAQGISPQVLSSILGTPHLVVCFAQLPYESRISESTEYQPICASIMGARGTDLALINLVKETLNTAGWRTDIATGRLMYPLGNSSRNVDDGLQSDNDSMDGVKEALVEQVVFGVQWSVDEL